MPEPDAIEEVLELRPCSAALGEGARDRLLDGVRDLIQPGLSLDQLGDLAQSRNCHAILPRTYPPAPSLGGKGSDCEQRRR